MIELKKYTEFKPSCYLHGYAIEKVHKGNASWQCNRSNCKVKFIGLNIDLISKIWSKNWDESTMDYSEFKIQLACNNEIFRAPFSILCNAIQMSPSFLDILRKVNEDLTLMKLEEEMEEFARTSEYKKPRINHENLKLLRSNKECLACGVFPDAAGGCFC